MDRPFKTLDYALEKIRVRVGLLDPSRAASKAHATEMYTWTVVDDGLEDDLAAYEQWRQGLPEGMPKHQQELVERARSSLREIRRSISLDELGQQTDHQRIVQVAQGLEDVLRELRRDTESQD